MSVDAGGNFDTHLYHEETQLGVQTGRTNQQIAII